MSPTLLADMGKTARASSGWSAKAPLFAAAYLTPAASKPLQRRLRHLSSAPLSRQPAGKNFLFDRAFCSPFPKTTSSACRAAAR